MTLTASFIIQLKRDLLVLINQTDELLETMLYLCVLYLAIVLALEETTRSPVTSATMLWILVMINLIVHQEKIIRREHANGSLDHLIVCGQNPAWLLLAKFTALFIAQALPLIILAGLISLIQASQIEIFYKLVLSLLAASPAIICWSMLTSCLLLHRQNSISLGSLLTVPLCTPAIIFGTQALKANADPGALYLTFAVSLLALALAPVLMAMHLNNINDP